VSTNKTLFSKITTTKYWLVEFEQATHSPLVSRGVSWKKDLFVFVFFLTITNQSLTMTHLPARGLWLLERPYYSTANLDIFQISVESLPRRRKCLKSLSFSGENEPHEHDDGGMNKRKSRFRFQVVIHHLKERAGDNFLVRKSQTHCRPLLSLPKIIGRCRWCSVEPRQVANIRGFWYFQNPA